LTFTPVVSAPCYCSRHCLQEQQPQQKVAQAPHLQQQQQAAAPPGQQGPPVQEQRQVAAARLALHLEQQVQLQLVLRVMGRRLRSRQALAAAGVQQQLHHAVSKQA
jgi:hypothetical protein